MVTEQEIKKQFNKVQNLAIKFTHESNLFHNLMAEYYGEESYHDHDRDEIIDCLDYGQDKISFKEFDRIMKEINQK